MAVPHVTSGERAELYRRLFLINRCFHYIVKHIANLENRRKLKAQHSEELRGLAQEVQLHINNRLLEEVHTVEREDWYSFGRICSGMAKRLNSARK